MKSNLSLLAALFVSALLGGGCDRQPSEKADEKPGSTVVVAEAEALVREQVNFDDAVEVGGWDEHIDSHSSGWLPAESPISIRFHHPVLALENVNDDNLRSMVQLEPELGFSVTAASEQELLITPTERLPSGQVVSVALAAAGLQSVSPSLEPYRFRLQVLEQGVDIKIDGLVPDDDNLKQAMQLSGSLVTRDTADKDAVEAVLSAALRGADIEIDWQHQSDRLQHSFVIANIERREVAADLLLQWNSDAIGASGQGSELLSVPALNQFSVTAVRSVQRPEQYVEVSFSESLDRNQNLNGLIQLNDETVNARVDGSRLRVFPRNKASGEMKLMIASSLQSSKRLSLSDDYSASVTFVSELPGVKFAGSGSILPPAKYLTVPFEAVNVDSVWVTAFKVPESNLAQFLQKNTISSKNSDRSPDVSVGRYLWKKKINLPQIPRDQWLRFQLDLSDLMPLNKGSLINLSLSIDADASVYPCSAPVKSKAEELNNYEGPGNWSGEEKPDWYQQYYSAENGYLAWDQRDNPCDAAFYRYGDNVSSDRNFIVSNIGLMAKRGVDKTLQLVATDITTAQSLSAAELIVYNYQQQEIGRGKTDSQGLVSIKPRGVPFSVVARHGGEVGYLKLANNLALPTSQFDVGGQKVNRGLKGFIYGERDVWRPGDDIHLSFVLQDDASSLPAGHPVSVDFFDPRGTKVTSRVNSNPVGSIYTFTLSTDEVAPTGNYRAVVRVGGELFDKVIKVETITPNRLKLELIPAQTPIVKNSQPLRTEISAQWLSGPAAKNLRADSEMKLKPSKTQFEGFSQYLFDDPASNFRSDSRKVFDGLLDDQGRAAFDLQLGDIDNAPGALTATFVSRVFEQSGEFSKTIRNFEVMPFEHWVGLNIAKGSGYRDAISRDQDHPLQLVSIDTDGKVQANRKLQLSIYRLGWRWWWDQSQENLANYIRSHHGERIVEKELLTDEQGIARWTLEKDKYDWGRHLIRVCDLGAKAGDLGVDGKDSGHCSGKKVYLGWSWSNQLNPDSATQLMLATDKDRYKVGETAKIQIPAIESGRLFYSLENGSRILEQRWLDLDPAATSFEIPLTSEMAPNAYVSLTLLQPHQSRGSDAPIRLYGVVPLLVEDPDSRLTPVINAPEEVRPESELSLTVSERDGRAMDYTVALVDEGLLGLTGFNTPDPHDSFYRREALGVSSWDMFDGVIGAYGADLERLLRIGGGDKGKDGDRKKQRRFPPVVKFLGAFSLKAGESRDHKIQLPQYMGAVRLMVVAANNGGNQSGGQSFDKSADQSAYGSVEKTVKVTQPLTLLATLPRVLGPGEKVSLPVNVFSSSDKISAVKISAVATKPYRLLKNSAELTFNGAGDDIAQLQLQVDDAIGMGSVTVTAEAEIVDTNGSKTTERSEQTIHIESRTPNLASTRQLSKLLQPGESWSPTIAPHGLAGSNQSSVFVSSLPALNLDKRLGYLIRYPHGCVEQTTSAIFPQIQLHHLVELKDKQRDDIQYHVGEAIKKLRRYQRSDGSFSYWPGQTYVNDWASNYVTHFLVEAKKQGYAVPQQMLEDALAYLASLASRSIDDQSYSKRVAAYRLYVMALAGRADLAAMNRLREDLIKDSQQITGQSPGKYPVARWQLALAYQKQGLKDIAGELLLTGDNQFDSYRGTSYEDHYTYGSDLRDLSIRLMAEQEHLPEAAWQDAERIAEQLSGEQWYSTQSLSWALIAMADFVAMDKSTANKSSANKVSSNRFAIKQAGEKQWQALETITPLYRQALLGSPDSVTVRNDSDHALNAIFSHTGIAKPGDEQSSQQGLSLKIEYFDLQGQPLDVSRLQQGQDFIARVNVSSPNTERRFKLEDIALSMVMPSGWQIRNQRLEGEATPKGLDYQDIRDDRVLSYFSLWRNYYWNYRYSDRNQSTVSLEVLLNATYAGKFYLPGWEVKAMYDEEVRARSTGQWVEVVGD